MRHAVKQLEHPDPGSGTAVVARDALRGIGASGRPFVASEGPAGSVETVETVDNDWRVSRYQ